MSSRRRARLSDECGDPGWSGPGVAAGQVWGHSEVAPEACGLGAVVSSAEARELGGCCLAGWAVGVVGLDVVEVAVSGVGLAAGEHAGLVAEDDLFADPLGWVVPVDRRFGSGGVAGVHPDDGLDLDA